MTGSARVYELSRRLGLSHTNVLACLLELGYEVKSHSSIVDATAVKELSAYIKKKGKKAVLAMDRLPEEKGRRIRLIRNNDSEDDADNARGSRVPKKPYPNDGDSSIRLPLPTKKEED